jgi:KUP system potassium uptake protein
MQEINVKKATFGGVLIALGIVFGDLGTSPLYTYKAIIGDRVIDETLILGSVSAIFWTLTFLTTIKYVFITMRADNHGEGGIFSLYALIRRTGKWLLWPAIIGGSFMIADSLITPPISVMSAIEGLKDVGPNIPILPITLSILVLLFLLQQAGTGSIGKFFGPAMILWFTMIAILGVVNLSTDFSVLRALNPLYAVRMVTAPNGFWVLGGVFLCATGAEALYADMGHVGRKNIQLAWILIKISLLLCYFGEAALLEKHLGQSIKEIDPFYGLVPHWFIIPSIVIGALATIIASQALISGTYTQFNEAIRLDLWPKLRTVFPSDLKGQVYVPAVNWAMMAGCIGMVLYFKESSNMEAAFGLSVTFTMLMTSVLLSRYLFTNHYPKLFTYAVLAFYLWLEITFLTANMKKFAHGGWLTFLIGSLLVITMYIWNRGRQIRRKYKKFVHVDQHLPILQRLSNDTNVAKFATHLVYLTAAPKAGIIEQRIINSIFCEQPKRADIYWMVHVEVDDSPYTMNYQTKIIAPDDLVYVRFRLGFRVVPRLNLFFRQIVQEMVDNKELNIEKTYCMIDEQNTCGDIRFVVMKSFLSFDNQLPYGRNLLMKLYFLLNKISISDPEAFGLDYNNVVMERVPLIIHEAQKINLTRETGHHG